MNIQNRIFFLVLILMSFSVVFTFSMSFFVLPGQKEPISIFYSQFAYSLVGIFVILVFQLFNRQNCYKILLLVGIISAIICLIMPLLPSSFIVDTKGAKRWIRLFGFSLAPLEFFKIGFISFLAYTYSRRITGDDKMLLSQIQTLAPTLILAILFFLHIYITQNDLGQCLVAFIVLLFMAMAAGIRFRVFLIFGGALVFCALIAILLNPTRLSRGAAWWAGVQDLILPFFPESLQDLLRTNTPEPYQISHSLNALTNGGMFGEGVGLGVFKLGFLTEVHTDFILTGMAEEIGYLGLCFIIILFIILIASIFKISVYLLNKRDRLFCYGYGVCLMLSFFMNVLGVNSIIPIKGIAVPFVSYGGSSMLANSMAIGAILCIFKNAGENKSIDKEKLCC